jgi:hypothetical protein
MLSISCTVNVLPHCVKTSGDDKLLANVNWMKMCNSSGLQCWRLHLQDSSPAPRRHPINDLSRFLVTTLVFHHIEDISTLHFSPNYLG